MPITALTPPTIRLATPRELDALIEVHVFGHAVKMNWAFPTPQPVYLASNCEHCETSLIPVRSYSTSGDDLLVLLGHLRGLGKQIALTGCPDVSDKTCWQCLVHDPKSGVSGEGDGDRVGRAVCVAVLTHIFNSIQAVQYTTVSNGKAKY